MSYTARRDLVVRAVLNLIFEHRNIFTVENVVVEFGGLKVLVKKLVVPELTAKLKDLVPLISFYSAASFLTFSIILPTPSKNMQIPIFPRLEKDCGT